MNKELTPRKTLRARLVHAAVLLLSFCVVFSFGIGVGVYHWSPFTILGRAKNAPTNPSEQSAHKTGTSVGEQRLLKLAFTRPLITREQINEPIASLDKIHEANRRMLLPIDKFFTAYEHLEILGAVSLVLDQGATNVVKITYLLAGNEYDAFAYSIGSAESTNAQAAALIIPGSGNNKASGIYENDPKNYHYGIVDALGKSFDQYILIKPNEDCLAIHNGHAKLDYYFIVNWLLNQGGSYSAHYIANSLAISKYLQMRYDTLVVAGLSQGGAAALLNSLQSQPNAAVIASGFSIISEKVQRANHNQIIIPGLQVVLPFNQIRSIIKAQRTRYLFTWGKQETGMYKIEADQHLSCRYLSGLSNVTCKVHDRGHVFPVDLIKQFLHTGTAKDR